MIFQSGRSIARWRSQCLRSRRTLFTSSTAERAPALYTLFSSSNDANSAFRQNLISSILRRSYADKPVSRPKAHTGRTTTIARRAPTTSATKAAKKPASTTKAAKAVPKTKSKAKPRIKAKPKSRKKAKAKPKSKPKSKRKVLTDKQKTAKTARQGREKVKALRERALLKGVKPTPSTAWTVFFAERAKADASGKNAAKLRDVAKDAAASYKAMTPEQLEHYNHLANQNKTANNTAYHKWLESFTPQQIRDANLARLALKRLAGTKFSQKYTAIKDDRQVKGAVSAYILFYQSRQASGDFKGLKATEASKLAGREWKALSAAEKKPFENSAEQDKQREAQEKKTVYNK